MAAGVIGVAMGLGAIALGLYAYVAPGAAAYFGRLTETVPYNLAAVIGFIPGGSPSCAPASAC